MRYVLFSIFLASHCQTASAARCADIFSLSAARSISARTERQAKSSLTPLWKSGARLFKNDSDRESFSSKINEYITVPEQSPLIAATKFVPYSHIQRISPHRAATPGHTSKNNLIGYLNGHKVHLKILDLPKSDVELYGGPEIAPLFFAAREGLWFERLNSVGIGATYYGITRTPHGLAIITEYLKGNLWSAGNGLPESTDVNLKIKLHDEVRSLLTYFSKEGVYAQDAQNIIQAPNRLVLIDPFLFNIYPNPATLNNLVYSRLTQSAFPLKFDHHQRVNGVNNRLQYTSQNVDADIAALLRVIEYSEIQNPRSYRYTYGTDQMAEYNGVQVNLRSGVLGPRLRDTSPEDVFRAAIFEGLWRERLEPAHILVPYLGLTINQKGQALIVTQIIDGESWSYRSTPRQFEDPVVLQRYIDQAVAIVKTMSQEQLLITEMEFVIDTQGRLLLVGEFSGGDGANVSHLNNRWLENLVYGQ